MPGSGSAQKEEGAERHLQKWSQCRVLLGTSQGTFGFNGQNYSQWDMSMSAPTKGGLQAGSGLWIKGFMQIRMVGETRPGDL